MGYKIKVLGCSPILNTQVSYAKSKFLMFHWRKPTYPWIKSNTDGSYRRHTAGIGGIFINNVGECLLFFQSPTDALNALQAEVLAVVWALQTAVVMGWNLLIVEMDSLWLFQLLKDNISPPWFLLHVVKQITHMKLTHNLQIIWKHIFREGNRCANWLAHQGALSMLPKVNTTPPMELSWLIKADLSDLPYIRRGMSTDVYFNHSI
ncbi:uncharacterized protein LOC110035638 [Phalaenopsis equestris]|uniref:uncharacterized protein LOC110035638 n=1 Tax=Phalaenopsis equestris TaxID=78828 RepID=UPI0009E32F39|nr:uncharacterized protein LOC110035638 [Phalaenopsis equestris]